MIKFLTVFFLIFTTSLQAASIKENPALITKTFDGENFDLQQQKGKVVIINFWAAWCIDCRKEIPLLEELYKTYHASGLEIIGVSIDSKKDRQKISDFSATLPYANSMFDEATENDFEKPKAIPLNYIIDKNGKVVAVINGDGGKLNKKSFEEIIKLLL